MSKIETFESQTIASTREKESWNQGFCLKREIVDLMAFWKKDCIVWFELNVGKCPSIALLMQEKCKKVFKVQLRLRRIELYRIRHLEGVIMSPTLQPHQYESRSL